MNTVKRYSVEATGMGLHLEGHVVGTIERAVVLASDFDAALAREVALREELRLAKRLQTTTDAIVIMVDGQRDHWIEKHNALQKRLTVAEQRAAFLERVMRDTLNDEDGLFITAEFNTGPTWSALQKHGRSIEAALKPAAEGENHG